MGSNLTSWKNLVERFYNNYDFFTIYQLKIEKLHLYLGRLLQPKMGAHPVKCSRYIGPNSDNTGEVWAIKNGGAAKSATRYQIAGIRTVDMPTIYWQLDTETIISHSEGLKYLEQSRMELIVENESTTGLPHDTIMSPKNKI